MSSRKKLIEHLFTIVLTAIIFIALVLVSGCFKQDGSYDSSYNDEQISDDLDDVNGADDANADIELQDVSQDVCNVNDDNCQEYGEGDSGAEIGSGDEAESASGNSLINAIRNSEKDKSDIPAPPAPGMA